MNSTSIHFRSQRHDWGTPQKLFNELNEEFHFTTDVCALSHNAKCDHYYSPEEDGLKQDWTGVCYCNPPYGREISKWIKKAQESSLNGTTTVCLVPARTDTSWWHDYIVKHNAEVRFLRGRVKFILNERERVTLLPSLPQLSFSGGVKHE